MQHCETPTGKNNLQMGTKGLYMWTSMQHLGRYGPMSTTARHVPRKHSLNTISELEKKFDSQESLKCSSPGEFCMYAVPSPLPQDNNYDIPVPLATEIQHKTIGGYSTLPSPHKTEWIYDVPMGPENQSSSQSFCDTLPVKITSRQIYNARLSRVCQDERGSLNPMHYDIPKPSSLDLLSPPKLLPRLPIYDKPPTQRLSEVYADLPKEEYLPQGLNGPPGDHIPLECRCESSNANDLTRVRLHRMTKFLTCTSLQDLEGSGELLVQEDDGQGKTLPFSAVDSQRISTASNSSTSSCDSMVLSSSSPELLQEVTLSQEEACCRLLELQELVCRAVPRLMEFVSSCWRSKEHLEKHLEEIKLAAEGIACSVTCFLNFALDIKGNTQHLSDANLQTRLCKQLSIVEDSGVIVQKTVDALNMANWPLSTLCQDLGQVQTPDQLERFVMVARTIPEDVKRLVSIINANGKLLFKVPQNDQENHNNKARQRDRKKNPDIAQQQGHPEEDDNDYVELQTKDDSEKQENEIQKEPKENATAAFHKAKGDKKQLSSESCDGTDEHRPASMSEHCRLYFGALQKAIGGFIGSLQDGQPPERFISHSKLVIMVGQRLVDTLCREAQHGGSSQSLLCKSSHLCALLKQLAVTTKKAALHFPDRQALLEAQEFAKELAQRAQHLRLSLNL
ncbi:cas scaffolding protein family member 4 [Aulostomus maculatus]